MTVPVRPAEAPPQETLANDGTRPPSRLTRTGHMVDRLLTAAGDLAATISVTEELAQQRAEILVTQRTLRGVHHQGGRRNGSLVSLTEAAARTGRHPEVLRRWCVEGRLPAVRIGRTWAITQETLAELLQHAGRSRPRLLSSRSP